MNEPESADHIRMRLNAIPRLGDPVRQTEAELGRERGRRVQTLVEGVALSVLCGSILPMPLVSSFGLSVVVGLVVGCVWHYGRTEPGVSGFIGAGAILITALSSAGVGVFLSVWCWFAILAAAGLSRFMAEQRQKDRMGI